MAVTVMLCFARSGGTVLNQCLGCLPNVVILSEINPLGGGWGVRGKESYTTVRSQAEHWYGIELSSDDFAEGIIELDQICQRHGKHLIVRDWSFVDFFPHDANGFNPPNRFLTLDAFRGRCDLRPFGFVRDSIDVWISRGTPVPEEFFLYYRCYIDALLSLDVPIFKYEEFCQDPRKVIQCICEYAELEYSESFWQYASFKKVNGDVQVKGGSRGMNQGNIAPLPRRLIDGESIQVINNSEDMREANRLLDYPQIYSTDHYKFEGDKNIEKGEVAFNKGDLKEAEKYFLEALKTDSRKKEAYNNLGVIAFQRQNIEESVDYFTKTLEIDPFYKDAIINYSVLLKSLDLFHESIPILETVVDKVPHDQELNHLLHEARLTKRSQAKIAVLCLPGLQSFLGDIVDYLKTKYDVRTCFSNNIQEIESAVRWADIVWVEWANELAVSVTSQPTLLEGKRVICRLHSYEALAGYPQQIKWENIHDLIFVAEHIKQIVQNQIPSIGRRVRCMHVISNGIDLDRFPFKERNKGKNLAFLGSVNYKKGPMLLFHAFRDLVQQDQEYRLFIGGNFQDSRYQLYFDQMARQVGITHNIQTDGWIQNVSEWLEDKHFIVCTSVLEGHPVGLMEAMSCGLKPVIHNYVGARYSYPDKYLWNTIPEFITNIRKGDYNAFEYRKFVEDRYPLQKQLAKIETVLRQSSGGALASEVAYPKRGDVEIQTPRLLDKSMPDISAVIAVRNGEKRIRAALDSLLSQTAPLRKIIVVDDCSNDQTAAIVKEYQSKYGQIIHLRQLNQNHWVFRARNVAFQLVDTEYFFFLDTDDKVAPNYAEILVSLLKKNPDCSFAYADMIYFDEHSERDISLPDFAPGLLGSKNYIPYSAMMVSKDFKEIGGYNNYLNDSRNHLTEWDLWLRFVRSGKKGIHCKERLFYYYQSVAQMSKNYERTRNDMAFQMAMSQKANVTLDLENRKRILFACQGKDYLSRAKVSFEVYTWLKPLSELGEVFTFFYDVESEHFGPQEMINRLFFMVDKIKPAYIFHPAFKEHIPLEVWKRISRDTLTIAWFSDDNWRFGTYSSNYCHGFRYSVTTYPQMADKYIDIGYRNVILSQWAANPYYFKDYGISKDIDVSFCGQNYGDRENLLHQLKVQCFGSGWPNGMLDFPEMAKTLSRSKMSINFSKGADGRMQMKCRPFEVSACNTLLLCEYTDLLDKYFTIGKEVVVFRDERELRKLIAYYLENEDERGKIAKAAFDRTLSEHTWKQRFADIFEEIERLSGSSTLSARASIREKREPNTPYDDQFYESHLKYKDLYYVIGDLISTELKPSSAIDWACGCGFLLEKLALSGVKKIHGIEGSKYASKFWANTIRSHIVVGDILEHDTGDKFDLAVCMEVAEHIPAVHADELVSKVAGSSSMYIWWTAAVPGQGGDGHVNCQPLSCWAEKFHRKGFDVDWELTYRIKLKLLSYPKMVLGYPWFRDNLMIFIKSGAKKRDYNQPIEWHDDISHEPPPNVEIMLTQSPGLQDGAR